MLAVGATARYIIQSLLLSLVILIDMNWVVLEEEAYDSRYRVMAFARRF